MDILIKLALGKQIEERDIEEALSEVCESVHSSCDSECPVYQANGGKAPNSKKDSRGCDCFKDGKAMLAFLRKHANKPVKNGDRVIIREGFEDEWRGIVVDDKPFGEGAILVRDALEEDWVVLGRDLRRE